METLQKGPQRCCCCLGVRGVGLPVRLSLSLSLTAPEDGKWCQSIHQSNTGGCAERRAGGVVMAACRGARRTITAPCCNHFRSPLWLMLQCLRGLARPCTLTVHGCKRESEGPPSQHLCVLHSLCPVVDARSPRLVRLKECAALIKDV